MPSVKWSTLSATQKFILLAIPVIVLIIISLFWLNPNNTNFSEAESSPKPKELFPPDGIPENKKEDFVFDFQPEKPIDGKLMGVIELGASGFNSFVVNIDAQKRWEMVSQDFGQSLIYEGLSTIDDVKRGLEEYISSLTKQGVEKKNIHFIISSGAQKNPKTKIIAAGLKNLGIDVKLITPNQEGQWALKCILPKSYYTKAFVADIGSGNTKLAWFDGKKVVVEEGPGSKYYEIDLKHDSVYKRLKKMAFNIPDSNRNICFIMGGTPSDLAKQNRNVSERYTKLQSPDTYEIKKAKTKAGLNIYKAIIDGTGCQTFIFDWDANFSIGYLLDLEQKEEN